MLLNYIFTKESFVGFEINFDSLILILLFNDRVHLRMKKSMPLVETKCLGQTAERIEEQRELFSDDFGREREK